MLKYLIKASNSNLEIVIKKHTYNYENQEVTYIHLSFNGKFLRVFTTTQD